MRSQHCSYWCHGAKAPGHQYPQCWLNIHCIGPVSLLKILHIRWTASENEITFWKKWPSHLRVKMIVLGVFNDTVLCFYRQPSVEIISWSETASKILIHNCTAMKTKVAVTCNGIKYELFITMGSLNLNKKLFIIIYTIYLSSLSISLYCCCLE